MGIDYVLTVKPAGRGYRKTMQMRVQAASEPPRGRYEMLGRIYRVLKVERVVSDTDT